ncbi:MAG: rRNA maturation RNase YbeY [Clostridia bacterium]|nr:rRNA maturation RNase YbeY [Clostridia bacterium]
MIDILGASKEEKEFLSHVLTEGLALMKASAADLDLRVVGRERIRALNREEREVDRVTDVLSFPTIERVRLPLRAEECPLDVDPATGRVYLGSIVICRSRAREQALEYGHSYARELAYLAVHGMLHLLSFDHIEEEDRARMRRAEEKILSALDVRR